MMKKFVLFALAWATLAPPSRAVTRGTVEIPKDVIVGSTDIPTGEYKLTYEGSGPIVSVFLSQPGRAPIVLNAKLLPSLCSEVSVTLEKKADGEYILRYINVRKAILMF
jgi:hypothetical protein